ncbi:polysaccharide deacetylase family protein [Candidatus Peregrinibacteria bacterium]|nr:MAG: polysaccharide deacetylase family protein [Candidatus Peregrinibacteria bacterium]
MQKFFFRLGLFSLVLFAFSGFSDFSEAAGNLIPNGDFEKAEPGISKYPDDWRQRGSAIFGFSFSYPATGKDGNGVSLQKLNSFPLQGWWYFLPVTVTPGKTYHYHHNYKSSTATEIRAQYTLTNRLKQTVLLGSVPASENWSNIEFSFVAPANAKNITVYQSLSKVGTLSIDNASLEEEAVTDTTPPTVSLTTPTNGATVSDSITVQANATDNIGVTGVQFLLDGSPLQSEVISAPYTLSLDTKTITNGAHTLSATARDATGNTATATEISVTVSNVVSPPPPPPPTSQNLVQNPSFQEGQNGVPLSWEQGSWGTHTSTFEYPVTGRTDALAARVTITNYGTEGDAKWVFDAIPVTAGESFLYEDYYQSDIPSELTVMFHLSDGTDTFQYLGAPEASPSTWKKATASFFTPENAVSVTVFHLIRQNGSLTLDDISLSKNTDSAFSTGFVTLSFDDGWVTHFTNAKPILEAANMKGSFYIITDEMKSAPSLSNLISNAGFEVGTEGQPNEWESNIWSDATAQFSYPVPGHTGVAASVTVTQANGGDAKWFFDEVLVSGGASYTYSEYYKSNVSTETVAQYLLSDGTYQYDFVDDVPSSSSEWQPYSVTLTMPANATTFSLLHTITVPGELAIDDTSLSTPGGGIINDETYMSASEVRQLEQSGHEIGSHTKTHPSLPLLSFAQAQEEIEGSKSDLLATGISLVNTFVYPYGDYNNGIVDMVRNAGYIGARTVVRGENEHNSDPLLLKTQEVDRNTTIEDVRAWIQEAKTTKTWLVLMFHRIDDSTDFYGNSPALLEQIVSEISQSNMPVKTLREGVQLLTPAS